MIQWLKAFIEEKRRPKSPKKRKKKDGVDRKKLRKSVNSRKNSVPSEDKIMKANRKGASWRKWRETEDTLNPPPSRKRKLEETLNKVIESQKRYKRV